MRIKSLRSWMAGGAILISLQLNVQVVESSESKKSEWYSRYPIYPEYCSTPDQMAKRAIPELKEDKLVTGDTRLVHVTAISRHGARTVLGSSKCWDGFWQNDETGVWDCDLTMLFAPPSPERIHQEEHTAQSQKQAMFLFDKRYDAPVKNILNGTCQEGQLILRGYDQQYTNGRMLRDAYLYDENEYVHDIRLRLFDIGQSSRIDPWDQGNVYLRSDDDERTLLSSQVLLRGLFEGELAGLPYEEHPTISVHTADASNDIFPTGIEQEEKCPKLKELREIAEQSKEYLDYYSGKEAKEVREFLRKHLNEDPGTFDCLMSTVCTDRTLPDSLNAYNPHPHSWFSRIENYRTFNFSYPMRHDDRAYAKTMSASLWAEILDHIKPIVDTTYTRVKVTNPAKLALYSGTDWTIMAILSSLGGDVWDGLQWPAYASMILLEIHEFVSEHDRETFRSLYAFRLIYNGEVLTHKVEGCSLDSDLCDVNILILNVEKFATRDVNCTDTRAKNELVEATKSLVSKSEGLLLVLVVVVACLFLGAMCMFFYLTGVLPTKEGLEAFQEQREMIRDREGRESLVVTEEVEFSTGNASSPAFDEDYPIS